jgi:hypothetical protein
MKILKLLNKKIILNSLFFFCVFSFSSFSNEPVDIWSIGPQKPIDKTLENKKSESEEISTNTIYEINSKKKNEIKIDIEQDDSLISKKINIAGIYDPQENNLTMDMWSNSNGEQILNIFSKIKKIKLSNDAKEILNISFLTNSYYPVQNITSEEFLNIKIEWLIKNNNFKLIEEFLFENKNIDKNSKLVKFLVNEYLSDSKIEKACGIFSNISEAIKDNYLSKFNIYCLISQSKKEEAQLLFDLQKELNFNDVFFEKKFNYLMGYEDKIDQTISEKSILDFHLSHRTNPDFQFVPTKNTKKNIWRYLLTSNLLDDIEDIDLEDLNKITLIEKATHEKNYNEKELFELYKRFQFNIDQLITVKQSYKLLSNVEARALIYQGILITNEINAKVELIKLLKNLFIKDGIGNAFKIELVKILKEIDIDKMPSNYTNFYKVYMSEEQPILTNIKINNKIIHQSKLLNYFRNESSLKNAQKDLNDILKKIKKDKKYYVSIKDIIMIESLKSDGLEVQKKYNNLYEVSTSNMPTDIQSLINNNDTGAALLRIVEIIGQDELKDIDLETLEFIISALNQLNIDSLRNKMILKILPLKV